MTDVEEQYRDSRNLTARADLHAKYGTATINWFDWVAQQVNWPANADVLEVGCGTGWLWSSVTAPISLTLVDLSPGMLVEATVAVDGLPNIELVETAVADAQALPFDDDSFDIVVANHMLYHVPDPSNAIAEVARVLRPRGTLIAATNGRDHMKEIFQIHAEVLGDNPFSVMPDVFGRENGGDLLRARFASVEWRAYEDELRCTDVDDVVAYITSTGGTDNHARLRTAVAQRFVDGVMTVTKDSGLFVAIMTAL